MKRNLLSTFLALVMITGLFPLTASADSLGQNIVYLDADTMEAINPYGSVDNLNLTFQRPDGTTFQCEGRRLETDWEIYFDTFSYFTSAGLYTLKSYPIPRGYSVVEVYSEDWDDYDSSGNLKTKRVPNGFIVSEITSWSGTNFSISSLSNTINVLVRKTGGTSNANAATPVIITQPSDVTVNKGQSATLKVAASVSKGTLSYQWYSNTSKSNSGGTPVRGATNTTFNAPTEGTFLLYYYCVVTNTDNSATGSKTASVASNAAGVTVNPVTTQTGDNSIKKKTLQFRSKIADDDSDNSPHYTNIEVDWGWDLFDTNAVTYDRNLAIAGLALSTAAEDSRDAVYFMLRELGFDENKIKSYDYSTYVEQFTRVAHTFGYQKIKFGQAEYNIFVIVNRGTHDASDILTDLLSITDGFSAASNRTLSDFRQYVSSEIGKTTAQLSKENNIFFITGHSLGGAVANNLSVEFEDLTVRNKIFVYTFASPQTKVALFNLSQLDRNNVHNIVNAEDVVPIVPPTRDAKIGSIRSFHRRSISNIGYWFDILAGGKKIAGNPITAHSPVTYMAALLAADDYTISHTNSGMKLVKVKCPVDVKVFSDGKLVGSVVGGVAKYTDIFIYVDGDEKYIYMPPEQAFEINLMGTDSGAMEYSIVEHDGNGTAQREIVYENVPLRKGIEYFGKVNEEIGISASNYNLTSDDGTVIPYSYISTGNTDTLDSASEWARDGIRSAIAKGFVPAELQNNYKNVITRAEFCRMAVKWVEYATGKSIDAVLAEKGVSRNPNAFTDTNDADILAAYALGITSGTGNNKFDPNGQFTREQAATMIMNTCKAIGADVSNPADSGFADLKTASTWAVTGINFVRANGIMQGTGNNNFSPKTTYTREQSILTFNNINPASLPKPSAQNQADNSAIVKNTLPTVSAGIGYSLAVDNTGSLWAWGDNLLGQLGDSTEQRRLAPVKIMDNVAYASANTPFSAPFWDSSHSVAIKTDGSLWVWGGNSEGQLGNGKTKESVSTPVKIMENVASVSAGAMHTLALKTDGSVWTWGMSNRGALGDGTTADSAVPIKVMDDVVAISAGAWHSMAIKKDGSLWAWGSNTRGELGNGTETDSLSPIKIMDDVKAVSAGNDFTMAIKKDGTLWSWGMNFYGQLGETDSYSRSTPAKVMDNVAFVSAGCWHTMAIKTDGSLWGWGQGYNGQIGNNKEDEKNAPVKIMDDVVSVSAGQYHTIAAKKDGSIWVWGDNANGWLGDGTKTDRLIPTKITFGK